MKTIIVPYYVTPTSAEFHFDTFTDADDTVLSSHTSNSGHSYTRHGSFTTDQLIIRSNRCAKDTNTVTSAYYSSAVPSSANYQIEADIVEISEISRAAGICARMSTSEDSAVIVRRRDTTSWQLLKIVATTVSSLELVTTSFVANRSTRLKLVCNGNQFSFYLDGVISPSSPHTITDSVLQNAGRVGVRMSNNQTAAGFHIDNFSASYI